MLTCCALRLSPALAHAAGLWSDCVHTDPCHSTSQSCCALPHPILRAHLLCTPSGLYAAGAPAARARATAAVHYLYQMLLHQLQVPPWGAPRTRLAGACHLRLPLLLPSGSEATCQTSPPAGAAGRCEAAAGMVAACPHPAQCPVPAVPCAPAASTCPCWWMCTVRGCSPQVPHTHLHHIIPRQQARGQVAAGAAPPLAAVVVARLAAAAAAVCWAAAGPPGRLGGGLVAQGAGWQSLRCMRVHGGVSRWPVSTGVVVCVPALVCQHVSFLWCGYRGVSVSVMHGMQPRWQCAARQHQCRRGALPGDA